MSMLQELPEVTECTVEGCGYNHDHDCHAGAVTIAGHTGDASCATFVPLSTKGGLDKVIAHVGACQRTDCTHNSELECAAPAIRVGAGPDDAAHADCLTFATR
ncbi:protein of unknown function DUF1540 [Xylanimonas cellulosilytica DSM 15894]|uniref:DUF1540 domain-containing protein n=1 Tax=Xylanimonas cellulosilytica (strain DSM 15894 / JCM 12276 / CECT 5975 / KCTC 9989 / LMG 20990 / NBRC 107835 / XIL07) TaxID=446471 RepID=D1BRG6_XYLCX|nr:DUF1540 domain-containing protein [Xylanimonas cellulosilytica]ACZ30421.1 protein of unknown function DUF1540 [Xylanimonas cellulosilytica DSM 15894]